MKLKFFIVAILFIFTAPMYARAQANMPSSPDGIVVTTDPENPAPGDSVTITIQDYQSDINKANISWLLDRKQYAKGVGKYSISVTAPSSGKTLEVMAVIDTVEGAEIRKVVNIKSGDIDMVWETGGYAPAFYRGKSQFSYQNYLKVVAVPHFVDADGNPIKPSQLVYKWKQDDTVLQDQSGFGKQSVIVKGDVVPRPFNIDVQISSLDGNSSGVGELRFEAVPPSIVFYPDDLLYGVYYNRAVGDMFPLSNSEVKIIAAPYGFNINSGLSYEWSINNVPHDELAQSKNIVLRVNGSDQGRSVIALTMKNIGDDILQSATAGFTAIFNGKSQSANNVTF
jgi:hypothetical protein